MLEYLLAATDESVGKVIFFIVFILLWVGSAIASKVGKAKKKEQENQRRLRDIIAQEHKRVEKEKRRQQSKPMDLPPVLPTPQQRQHRRPIERKPIEARPMPQPVKAPPLPQQQSQKQQRRQRRPQPAMAVQQQVAAPIQQQRIVPTQTQIGTPDEYTTIREIPAAISAQRLRRVLRPKNMQAAYILTEILQPPMSLRDPRH